ncbi:MAG TPA: MBL fold metallo-hydrolase [candidate division Zixibacteria bacterium]|nr:MBL fold metallo-hydrolase [candidate division Zixibacteria bacterium]
MEITWYGRACFRLKGREATVITDPCPPSTGFVAGKHDVDLLTISHAHPDHSYTRSITAGLTLTRPGEYEYHGVLATGVRTFHDGSGGSERGENVVFSVEVDGVHVCHLGDLGHLLTEEQLTELGPVDVLLVPAGGTYTISPAEAAEVVAQVSPKIVIPMHYATDGASADLLGPEKFVHEMGMGEPVRQPKAVVHPSSLPDETQVVLLEPRGRSG